MNATCEQKPSLEAEAVALRAVRILCSYGATPDQDMAHDVAKEIDQLVEAKLEHLKGLAARELAQVVHCLKVAQDRIAECDGDYARQARAMEDCCRENCQLKERVKALSRRRRGRAK